MTQEKRVFPRFHVELTAHCRIGNRFIRDTVGDLSEGGFYLKTKEPAREGTPVRAVLALPAEHGSRICTLVGNVARLDRDVKGHLRGIGISFAGDQIASFDRRSLTDYLSQHAA
jgi:hypothetical protein